MSVFALGERVPSIDPSAFVHPDATVIGAVTIGPESTVWPGAVLRGDYGEIFVGARTSVQDGTVVHATADLPTGLTPAEASRHVFVVAADRSFWMATIFLAATLLLVTFAIRTRRPTA